MGNLFCKTDDNGKNATAGNSDPNFHQSWLVNKADHWLRFNVDGETASDRKYHMHTIAFRSMTVVGKWLHYIYVHAIN